MLDKLKQNKIWLTVIAFGIIIVIILLMMLNQQKQNSPAAQESSYSSSVKASSSSAVDQDKANEKAYAKKAATMKGHVLYMGDNSYFTSWTEQNFKDWAKKYSELSDVEKHNHLEESFGTKEKIVNDKNSFQNPLDEWYKQIVENGVPTNYFSTVKAFNKKYSGINPDDIIK